MKNNHYRRDNCRMCFSKEITEVIKLTPTPVGSHYIPRSDELPVQAEYPIDLFQCGNCGYVGIVDVIDGNVLFSDNTEDTSMSLGQVEHLREYSQFILDHENVAEGALIVDIGSNDGTFLQFFKEHRMNVLGVDPSGHIVDKANGLGVPTINDFFTTERAKIIKSEYGSASIICANRVIANIDDLNDMLEGVRILLSPDGAFYFETGYLVDILDNLLFDTIYHEHLGYDLVKPLESLFLRYGMRLIDIQRVGLKGGSLRGMVRLVAETQIINPSVSKLIAMEESKSLYSSVGYQEFNDSLSNSKYALTDLLNGLVGEGKVIAGYGASVGSTTQIYYLGLGDTLEMLLDDDPRNQEFLSPGYHIPVFSSDVIYEQKPDYIVILAWRYADPIMRRHQKFLDQGGHFIIPMPSVRVV